MLSQLGFLPPWLAGLLTVVIFLFLGYLLARWLLRRAVPWLGTRLAGPLSAGVVHMGQLTLLPEYGLTRSCRRAGRPPPGISYRYGDVVAWCTERAANATRLALMATRVLSKTPRLLIVVMLLATFAFWNADHCSATRPACRSPVSSWTISVQAWWKTTKPAPATTRHAPPKPKKKVVHHSG
ncbi:MAG: hypothetical protein ACJ73E_05640 [Mycobacteriales bacterium]